MSSNVNGLKVPPSLLERYRGCLLGLACGDAVGTAVEFERRGSFPLVTDMSGGGPFDLKPGQWTDDTSMALCLAESLIKMEGLNARDQMDRYVRWWRNGYLSATGKCFDIGMTTETALRRFEETGDPIAGDTDQCSAGNGSLMRLAPVVLFFYPAVEDVLRYSAESSRTTHAAHEAIECCMVLGDRICGALSGDSKEDILHRKVAAVVQPKVKALTKPAFLRKTQDAIVGSGYSVSSLEAALWCFARTDSFEQAILDAVNLGDDADTTAAITGQIAGAYYGIQGIPSHWLERLHMRTFIDELARGLYAAVIDR